MPLEGHTVAVVFYQSFEKYSRDSNYKDNRSGWLMRRKTKKGWGWLIITWSLYVIANDKFGNLLGDIHLLQLESKQSSGLGSQINHRKSWVLGKFKFHPKYICYGKVQPWMGKMGFCDNEWRHLWKCIQYSWLHKSLSLLNLKKGLIPSF